MTRPSEHELREAWEHRRDDPERAAAVVRVFLEEAQPDDAGWVVGTVLAAWVAKVDDDLDRAAELATRVQERDDAAPSWRARAHIVRTNVAIALGEHGQADAEGRAALALLDGVDDADGQSWALVLLGINAVRAGNPADGMAWLAHALAVARGGGSRHGEWSALTNLAALEHELGDLVLAHEHLQLASALAREHGPPHDAVRTAVSLAHVLVELGHGADALATVEEALRLAGGSPRFLTNALACQARILVELGELEQAQEVGRVCIELAQTRGDLVHVADARVAIGRARCGVGHLDDGLGDIRTGIDLYLAHGQALHAAEAELAIADILVQRAWDVTAPASWLERATGWTRLAYDHASSVPLARLPIACKEREAEILERLGRPNDALAALRAAQRHRDELDLERDRQRIESTRMHDELAAALRAAQAARDNQQSLALAYGRLRELNEELRRGANEREELVERLRTQTQRLEQLARTDGLTGVLNRRATLEHLAIELGRHKRSGSGLAIALLDVDHFKRVNDDWSHAAGDQVLVRLATLLRRECRAHDIVGRFGGEEFVIGFPGLGPSESLQACERIRRLIEVEPWSQVGANLQITVSIGVCGDPAELDVPGMLSAADKALYAAKHAGRNKVEAA